MSILTRCSCGTRFKAKETSVGKRVKCPSCGRAALIEAPEPEEEPIEEEEEESPRKKSKKKSEGKKKKKRSNEASVLQTPVLGLRLGAWLMLVLAVAVIGGAAAIIVPRAFPAAGTEPYYTKKAENGYIQVMIYNTPVGDIPVHVKMKRSRVVENFAAATGMPEFEWVNVEKGGELSHDGKTARWFVKCEKDNGITEVTVDGKNIPLGF